MGGVGGEPPTPTLPVNREGVNTPLYITAEIQGLHGIYLLESDSYKAKKMAFREPKSKFGLFAKMA